LVAEFAAQALAARPALGEAHNARRWLYETIRLMLSHQVYDLIAATEAALASHQPDSVEAVRRCPDLLVFSPGMRASNQELKAFLMAALYRHPQVVDTMDRAKQMVRDLFAVYLNDPKAMQTGSAPRPLGESEPDGPRAVADYIAGMTDRFAAREHERLTGQRLLV
jgi:dGTPase